MPFSKIVGFDVTPLMPSCSTRSRMRAVVEQVAVEVVDPDGLSERLDLSQLVAHCVSPCPIGRFHPSLRGPTGARRPLIGGFFAPRARIRANSGDKSCALGHSGDRGESRLGRSHGWAHWRLAAILVAAAPASAATPDPLGAVPAQAAQAVSGTVAAVPNPAQTAVAAVAPATSSVGHAVEAAARPVERVGDGGPLGGSRADPATRGAGPTGVAPQARARCDPSTRLRAR